MPRHQISPHIVRIYDFVASQKGYTATDEIAAYADVSGSTARHHSLELVTMGLFERVEVFGGYRYRIAAPQTPEGKQYLEKIEAARAVFSADL
jgi:DNA-binding MarR family transcriptional regulator